MKIIETTTTSEEDGDRRISIKVTTASGKNIELSFGSGEPEDMILGRDLNDAYSLFDLAIICYEAGRNGEGLICERNESKDEEDDED